MVCLSDCCRSREPEKLEEIQLELLEMELADLNVERTHLEKGFLASFRNREAITKNVNFQNELIDLREKIQKRCEATAIIPEIM